MRERDNEDWHVNAHGGSGDPTAWVLSDRRCLLQNWRGDVVMATDAAGNVTDRIRYTAYGEPVRWSLIDLVAGGDGTPPDGIVDGNDYIAFINAFSAGEALADINLDGVVDANDYLMFFALLGADDGAALGLGTLSGELDGGFRRGYAGYEFDPVLGAAGASVYHVRNRVYDAENGRWTRRDPLGYIDGMGLYEYCGSGPVMSLDPMGLIGDPGLMVTLTMPDLDRNAGIAKGIVSGLYGIFVGSFVNIGERIGEAGVHEAEQPGGNPDSVAGMMLYQAGYEAVTLPYNIFEGIHESVKSVISGVTGVDANTGMPLSKEEAGMALGNGATNLGALVLGGKAALSNPGRAAALGSKPCAGSSAGQGVRHGPLSEGPLGVELGNTFRGGSYTESLLDSDLVLYRAWGDRSGEIGSWMTRTMPQGPLQAKMDLALKPEWGNSAANVSSFVVPRGTTIYEGFAASQGSGSPGGGSQVFIRRVSRDWLVPHEAH